MIKNKYIVLALKICAVILTLGFLTVLSVFIVSAGMVSATDELIYENESIPTMADGEFDYILVLGAGVRADGSLTDMLRDRVIVGARLYLDGVADKIIMSGDRSGESYDEPTAMKKYAMENFGIPEEDIICDFEGFSTHDSIDGFEEDYENASVVVVSQKYHLHRAIYLCKEQGIDNYIGVEADLDTYRKQMIYDFREIFARFKDFMFLE